MPPPSVIIVRDLRFGIGQLARLNPVFDLLADETNQRGVFLGIEARESFARPSNRTLAHRRWGDQRATPTGTDCPRVSSVSSEKTA